MTILSGEDIFEAEDAWQAAVDEFGAESDEAREALAEFERLQRLYDAQRDAEPDWDEIED